MPSITKLKLLDCLILSLFLVLALMHHLGRWGGAYPFPSVPALGQFGYLGGDAANIASFAAGLDAPELFEGDEVLADRRNFQVYSVIHVPAIRALARMTGDYSSAFISLLGLHVFVQAAGFYLLGIVILQSRYWAAVLALVTLMPVELNLGEYWGVYPDPQPRFSFQALLPFLLAAAFYWRSKPLVWPALMVGAAGLIYIHPVSAPAWGLAIWLGFWAFRPPSWTLTRWFGYMLLLGGVFLAVSTPFLMNYLHNFAHGEPQTGVAYDKVIEVMRFRYDIGFLDLRKALADFIGLWRDQWFYWWWPVAGVGLMIAGRRTDRHCVALVMLWVVGLLVAAVGIPFIDQGVSRALGRLPIEIDLIRGIRYTVPLMLLLCLWPVAALTSREHHGAGSRSVRHGAHVFGVLLATLWIHTYPPTLMAHTFGCWGQGKFVCEWPEPAEGWWPEVSAFTEALNALRLFTPPGSTILSTSSDYALHIRYYAQRPVVYSFKDGGILGYSNHGALLKWYDRQLKLKAVMQEADPVIKIRDLVALSRTFGAKYILVDFADSPEIRFPSAVLAATPATAIWSNKLFGLLKVEPFPPPTQPHARN